MLIRTLKYTTLILQCGIACVLCTAGERLVARDGAAIDCPAAISLSGTDWRIHDEPSEERKDRCFVEADMAGTDWISATVPGNIQADLEAAHQLYPLWYGVGDARLYDVACKNWWYRKDWNVPASFAGKRATLIFDGVDHACEVWLNGKRIGANAGMFRRFWFDVADVLCPGQTNHLAVRIARMPESLASLIIQTDGPMSGQTAGCWFLDGINHTRRTLKELKSPTNFGWDWGTNIWTLGIWKDVRLVASGPARIDWSHVQTTLTDKGAKADIAVMLEVDSSIDQSVQSRFRIIGNGRDIAATIHAALKKGRNLVQTKLSLDQPALWWPNGQGGQPLYELHAEILPEGGGPVIDAHSTRFGVREVRWTTTADAPTDFVCRYQLWVNGRPIRMMGSNLIPPDLLFGRAGPRGLQLLRQAKTAGMNTLRQWGGGVVLSDAFYDLADELGIMISFEFPLANAWPETDNEFLTNLEATSRNIVKQVRNHPSIIEFSGGNEMPWNSLTQHPALQLLQKVVAEEDDRMVRATCPDVNAHHGPYDFQMEELYRHYNTVETMRYGEFGTNSPAHIEVWYRDIPPKSQWPIGADNTDPVLIHKNVIQAAFTPEHWLLQSRIIDAFGTLDNLSDLIAAGQFLGAEGLRYAVDALRRKGSRIGGFTSWDFNEPWSNGAGSYLVDYDGRPLMNYDFFRQAMSPISLSLQYDALRYDPATGVKAELFLTSDAPQTAHNVRWQWLARDRRGTVIARNQGRASIAPQGVLRLDAIAVKPPAPTASGPVFIELQLFNAENVLLTERIHVFGLAMQGSLGGLLKNRTQDADDNNVELPNGPANLAYVGNGAKPATASSARVEDIHQSCGLNDGQYGNSHSWIGKDFVAWCEVDLGKPAVIGRFKLGRDRLGLYKDREIDYVKIETSTDEKQWKKVYEKSGIAALPDYRAENNIEILIAPTQAQFVKLTVNPRMIPGITANEMTCVDELEVYTSKADYRGKVPHLLMTRNECIVHPVRRTTLTIAAKPMQIDGDQELLELAVTNTGPMTALFCEPHPLLVYRTDLQIDNNHCFIPPGETRVMTICASRQSPCGLSLGQTGWRISTWNADDLLVEPNAEVLLSVGRRDQMCREFRGYADPCGIPKNQKTVCEGRRPNAAQVPYRLEDGDSIQFRFALDAALAKRPARLRIHAADQSKRTPTSVEVVLNGRTLQGVLPLGIGVQYDDPSHLAFPATLELPIAAADLRTGKNVLQIQVRGGGWFSWDALDLLSDTHSSLQQ